MTGMSRVSCAACKYQRRKCTPQCVLAPYFPANQPKKFQNAHRLFGVRNIVKTLEKLEDEDQKADAMKSIIYESDMREKFPVYGCVECIFCLNQQLDDTKQELEYVYAQLDMYRQQRSSESSVGNGMIMVPLFCNTEGESSNQGATYNIEGESSTQGATYPISHLSASSNQNQ